MLWAGFSLSPLTAALMPDYLPLVLSISPGSVRSFSPTWEHCEALPARCAHYRPGTPRAARDGLRRDPTSREIARCERPVSRPGACTIECAVPQWCDNGYERMRPCPPSTAPRPRRTLRSLVCRPGTNTIRSSPAAPTRPHPTATLAALARFPGH